MRILINDRFTQDTCKSLNAEAENLNELNKLYTLYDLI